MAHDLLDAFGVQGFLVLDPPQVVGAGRFQAVEVFQEDEVEGPLALPEVVLGDLDERAQKALQADDEPAQKAPMAPNGELVVPRPQPVAMPRDPGWARRENL